MVTSDLNDLPFAGTVEDTAKEEVTGLRSALAFCEDGLENGEVCWLVVADRESEGQFGVGCLLEE